MKLDFQDITVERSAAFESQNFDIGDKRIILEILRGKMYSNPIQTICQEISSNARDAHREVGKDSIPIEIKLPNKLEPAFWIRDFGPGITPARMSDVFIKYGCSTKRENNLQIGGWGLGAKSPFAYSDTFTIISITPEGSKMVRREYIAHIDESGLGQMSCVKEEVTTEPQGTTIMISPNEADYALFHEQVLRATAFWTVKPKILGVRDWKWPKMDIIYSGDRWEVHNASPVSGVLASPYAIIDGIPYPIKGEHLFKSVKPNFPNFKTVAIRVLFGVGEIPITASREEIDYQERTIQALEKRLNDAFTELHLQLTQSVSRATSLIKAVVTWRKAKKHPQFGHLVSNTSWAPPNAATTTQPIKLDNEIPLKDLYCDLFFRSSNEFGFTRAVGRAKSMILDETTLIVEDDSPTPSISRQRLANLFDSHQHIKRVYLLSFYHKATVETLTSSTGVVIQKKKIIVDEVSYPLNKKIAELSCHWNYLDTVLLSSYKKKEVVTAGKASTSPAQLMMRYLSGGSSRVSREPFETLSSDKTVKKYYLEGSGNNQFYQADTGEPVRLTGRDFDQAISHLTSLAGPIKIHFVTTRHKPLLDSSWVPLRDYIKELVKAEAAKHGGVLYSRRPGRAVDHFSEHFVKAFAKRLSEVTDQNCLPVKYFKEGVVNATNDVHAYNLAHSFGIEAKRENSDPMEGLYNQLIRQYPIFAHLQFSYYSSNDTSAIIADLISYVNMKTEQLKKAP